MKQIQAYLDWIGFPGRPCVSAGTLAGLHQGHAFRIPFENLDVMSRVPIALDPERFYEKMVGTHRGGLCFEMNGLFKLVLDRIGFASWFIGCQVYFPPAAILGHPMGHVAILARLGASLYLVDVGFGSGFIRPLRLVFGVPQIQLGTWYRFSRLPEAEVLLERSADGQHYQKMYKFTLMPRALADFAAACRYHQTSPQAPFTRQPLCSRPTSQGRITLTGSLLVITTHGERQEKAISSAAEFSEQLALYFGIRQER